MGKLLLLGTVAVMSSLLVGEGKMCGVAVAGVRGGVCGLPLAAAVAAGTHDGG